MRRKSNPPVGKKDTGEQVLSFLAERGDWRSGEELAEILGVSRAAVAKQVAGLRRAGHVIDSQTNRGYLLRIPYEKIDPEAVRRKLRTRVLGRGDWRTLAETPSTNTEAITWALAGGAAGSVVTAERQTRGKGRKGHDWFSSVHGLQFSLILDPAAGDERAITQAALDAVGGAVEKLSGLRPTPKQPNDLLLDGRKLCGVLVETGNRAGEPDWVALGIGCNVNVPAEDFPEAIGGRVTSLYAASGRSVSKNRLLAEILNRLEKRLK